MLQKAILELPKEEAEYHMKRCVESGLWVPNAADAQKAEASGSEITPESEYADIHAKQWQDPWRSCCALGCARYPVICEVHNAMDTREHLFHMLRYLHVRCWKQVYNTWSWKPVKELNFIHTGDIVKNVLLTVLYGVFSACQQWHTFSKWNYCLRLLALLTETVHKYRARALIGWDGSGWT